MADKPRLSNTIALGHIGNLEVTAKPSAIVGFLLMWLVLSTLGFFVINLSSLESFVGGFICAVLHYLSEVLHQLGHAGAARRTGYPMRGFRFVYVLGFSLYPKDEPELPGRVHVRRALGGPAVSFVVSVIALLIFLVAQNVGGLFYWIALWFFLDNFFVFFLGALLPLGFTDGSSILKWWGKP
jgi:hypothetical protein